MFNETIFSLIQKYCLFHFFKELSLYRKNMEKNISLDKTINKLKHVVSLRNEYVQFKTILCESLNKK